MGMHNKKNTFVKSATIGIGTVAAAISLATIVAPAASASVSCGGNCEVREVGAQPSATDTGTYPTGGTYPAGSSNYQNGYIKSSLIARPGSAGYGS